MIIIFILIYLVSLVIHLIICYRDNKYTIFKVGDLIDKMDGLSWFPILNTIVLIIIGIAIMALIIAKLLKLSVLWEKFRNIKIK